MLVETYLFGWNPALWDWPELADDRRKLARRGYLDTGWNSGRVRAIEPGSRAFLIRLGKPPKGIFASGTVMTAPVERPHWRDDKRARGEKSLSLIIRLDTLLDLPLVTFDDFAAPPWSRFRWGIRQSGTRVPSTLAAPLEALWQERLAQSAAPAPSRRKR